MEHTTTRYKREREQTYYHHLTADRRVICGPIVTADRYVGTPGRNFRRITERYVLTNIDWWLYPDQPHRPYMVIFSGAKLNADGTLDRRFASPTGGGLNTTVIQNPQATGEYFDTTDSWFKAVYG